MIRNTPYFHVWNSHADHGDHIVGLQDFTTKMSEHAKSMIGYGSNSWTSSYSYHIIVDLKRQNRLKVGIDTPNTPVTPGLRPYCDQFFDQIALDRSKVSLRSHYGLSVVAVGRTSRCMVVLVVLVAVRNFGMFKIPYCDFSIAVQSAAVCLRSYSSYCGRSTISQRGSP